MLDQLVVYLGLVRCSLDFEVRETDEQEEFRVWFRAWLEENIPKDMDIPPDGRVLSDDAQIKLKEFRLKLGSKGWLAPSWPVALGGGGMDVSLGEIIRDECSKLNLPTIGNNLRWVPAMMVWGTPEQKKDYIPPALRGETVTWQMFSETASGSDIASTATSAVRDGSDWLVSGRKAFITGRTVDPDYLCTLAVTDHDRPRRLNLGVFMIKASLPGISIVTQSLLTGSERHVYLDNVRIPTGCLIGDPYQGWEIVQTIIEGERGGQFFRGTEEATIDSILEYLRGGAED